MKLNHIQNRSLDLIALYNSAHKDKSIGFSYLRSYRCKSTKDRVFTDKEERYLKNRKLQVKKTSLKSLQSNRNIVPDSNAALTKYSYTPFVEGEDPFEHLYIEDQEGKTFPLYTKEIYESQYHPEAMTKKNPKSAIKPTSKYTNDKSVNFPTDDDDDKSEASSGSSALPTSTVSTADAFSKMQIIGTDGVVDGEPYDVRYRMPMDESKMCLSNDGVAVSYIDRGGMTMGDNGSQEKVHDVVKVLIACKTVGNIGIMATTPLRIIRSGQSILATVPAIKQDLIELLYQADKRLDGQQHIGGIETAQARNIDTDLMVTRIKKHSPDYLRIVIDIPGRVRVNGKELQKDLVKLLGENCAVGEVLHVETEDDSMNDGQGYVGSANGVVFYLAADRAEVLQEVEEVGLDAEDIKQRLLEDQMGRMSLDGKCTVG